MKNIINRIRSGTIHQLLKGASANQRISRPRFPSPLQLQLYQRLTERALILLTERCCMDLVRAIILSAAGVTDWCYLFMR